MNSGYPLMWPIGRPRIEEHARKWGALNKMPSARVYQLLGDEIRKMKETTNVTLSTNLQLRRDGLPYVGQKEPADPGAVLYFTRKGVDIAIACDVWHKLDANVRAIGLTVEAIRGMERWGTEEMVDRAFTGFKALPETSAIVTPYMRPWHEVLQVSPDADPEIIRAAWKRLVARYHPDNQATGDAVKFEEVQKAYNEVNGG
jgi:hypothetical protein